MRLHAAFSFTLSKGTGDGFCSPVPFFLPFSCFARVQTTTFALLYPKKADFWHIFGYRRRFLPFCTREKLISDIFSGTDDHFCSPVPFPRQISCSARVQMTTFTLLYPCAFSYSSAQSSAHLTAFCQPFRRAALVSSGIAGSKTLPSCQFAQISARSFQ